MRSVIPIRHSILALVLCAIPAFGQQSTTDTNCNVNGQQVNCTSNTTTNIPPPDPWANTLSNINNMNKNMAANRERAEARRAQARADAEAKHALENHAEVNMVYCKQNPSGSVTTTDGKDRSCADELAYEKAFCVVNPEADRCRLPASEAEVEKAFADLIEKYKNDPGAKKRSTQNYYESQFQKLREWGCRSFPDMTLPAWGKPDQPCTKASATALVAPSAPVSPSLMASTPAASALPYSAAPATATTAPVDSAPTVSAPISPASQASVTTPSTSKFTQEQKDAISYCQRNPTATITWNNGTVSPCSSVLGPR